MQSLLDGNGELGGIPAKVDGLFSQAYTANARIHTNSWGPTIPGLPYTSGNAGAEIDNFIKEHPDMLICFAAGNEGIDVDQNGVVNFMQIGKYAAAKNCLTVGASENYRPEQSVLYRAFADYRAEPLRTDKTANDSMGMAAFSNRGPSQEGRIKPDIVAPGTCILSTRSARAADRGDWGRSEDPSYMYKGGTSIACPLVAGGCALIRQALKKQKPEPSAAPVKALLINGAVELRGQYLPSEAGRSPNFSSGWGRVNLAESIAMAKFDEESEATVGCLEGEALRDTGFAEKEINNNEEGKTLKVTLVWTDLPGALLQNCLALSVTVGDNVRRGNPTSDRKNNVEQVVWSAIPMEKVVIKVEVKHLLRIHGEQDFALVWKLS